MNYESHIDELCKKLSKRIELLKHISPFLRQRQRETYYNGAIKPMHPPVSEHGLGQLQCRTSKQCFKISKKSGTHYA